MKTFVAILTAAALAPLAALAQAPDYQNFYTVAPEYFPVQQRAAAIIGQSAVSRYNHSFGDVSDVITDETQTVVGYLVDTGGIFGIGEKHVFVPEGRAAIRIDG
ncbi:MAG: PRC-barrel domain-containing protein, partial [Hyphomonas sp.]